VSTITFPSRKITVLGATYTPYIADDGRVGYQVVDRFGNTNLIYMNPRSDNFDLPPTVVVYAGREDDPALDTPQVFVNVWFFKEEST
jgi:hypothetical protein